MSKQSPLNSNIVEVPDTSEHGKHYSEKSFWDKVKEFAATVGGQGIYYALILYYVLMDDETPASQKGIILGALGYFILPIDLIPDLVPLVGFSDDIAAITAVLKMIWASVKSHHLEQAAKKTKEWFPSFKPKTPEF